jgi:hypothetical protein
MLADVPCRAKHLRRESAIAHEAGRSGDAGTLEGTAELLERLGAEVRKLTLGGAAESRAPSACLREAARVAGVGQKELVTTLADEGWIYKKAGVWRAYKAHREGGTKRLAHVMRPGNRGIQCRITFKGLCEALALGRLNKWRTLAKQDELRQRFEEVAT